MSKPEAAGDEYDPHDHRVVARGTTNMETAFHIVKGTIGTGVLAMPQAFKNSGLIIGFISTAIIGFIATWGMQILVQSQYIICKKLGIPLLKYPDAMKEALEMGPTRLRPLAKFMPVTVNLFLIVNQLGIGCIYTVFVASNFKLVFDQFMEKPWALEMYILTITLPLIAMLSVKNLKILAPFSLAANIVALVTFCVVGYYFFTNMPHIKHAAYFASPLKYPLYFGTTLFAILAIGVVSFPNTAGITKQIPSEDVMVWAIAVGFINVMSAENNMLTPKGFAPVLNISMFFVLLLYIFVGFVGYWRYGEDTKDSITLNFPPEEILTKIIVIAYALSIFVSFGLQEYVAVEIIWFTYLQPAVQKSKSQGYWEFLLRTSICVVSVVLACTVPLLGLIISLVGAFCLSALAIVFPGVMEMCAKWSNISVLVLCKDIFFIVFGLIGLLVGSGTTIYEMVLVLTK